MNTKYLFPGSENHFILKTKNACILKSDIKTVPNGIILPLRESDAHSGGAWYSGGVCDSEGNFLNESVYEGIYVKRGKGGGV